MPGLRVIQWLFVVFLVFLVCLTTCVGELDLDYCEYDGMLYDDGEMFPANDGCNMCMCNPDGQHPGQYECTEMPCSDKDQHDKAVDHR